MTSYKNSDFVSDESHIEMSAKGEPMPVGEPPSYGASTYQSHVSHAPTSPASSNFYLAPEAPRAVVDQPTAKPFTVSGQMPVSLEYLKTVTTLIVKQHIEILEIITDFETKNRFTIFNEQGQIIFTAKEQSDCCSRQCCGPARPFDMDIIDAYQQTVAVFQRPLRCACWCCFCCLNTMEVTAPPGTPIGRVDQTISFLTPNYAIKDELGNTQFRIRSPVCPCSCGADVIFKITSETTGEEVGEIRKKWGGFAQEMFTDADNFSITFPKDLDVKLKVVLLSALFLIDMQLYERKKN